MISIETILAIATAVTTASYFLYNRYNKRNYIKRIRSKDDPDIEELVEVYEKIIDSNVKIDQQCLILGLEVFKDYNLRDYLFVAKSAKKIIGFTDATMDLDRNFLFVSYFGIDKSNKIARENTSIRMASYLLKYITKKHRGINGIFFEVESPLNDISNSVRLSARIKTFKNLFKKIDFDAWEIDYDFIQPQISNSDGLILDEQKTRLMYVPFDKTSITTHIDKAIILKLLETIYFNIYDRVIKYSETDEVFIQNYPVYISGIHKKYIDELAQKIKVK